MIQLFRTECIHSPKTTEEEKKSECFISLSVFEFSVDVLQLLMSCHGAAAAAVFSSSFKRLSAHVCAMHIQIVEIYIGCTWF